MKKFFIILFLLVSVNSFSQEDSLCFFENKSKNIAFAVVDEMPRHKSCMNMNEEEANICTRNQILKYSNKMIYPSEYNTTCFEGKIYISFIVNIDGSITDVKVLKGFNKIFDKTATDHFKKMPKFATPGYLKKNAVRVKYNVPINITLG